MAPQRQLKLSRKQRLLNRKNGCPEADAKKLLTLTRLSETREIQPQPFTETCLGKLPAELRNLIYHELVATPPTHAGQELTTRGVSAGAPAQHRPATPATVFVHLKTSTITVLKTCRQIYKEAQPVFYARTSYYAPNEKELEQLIKFDCLWSSYSPLRTNQITSLCVKDIFTHTAAGRCFLRVHGYKSLRKLYLCMRVGEEIQYIEFLFRLPHMECGVIKFLDESHWMLHLQRPEEEWKIQYSCFPGKAYGQGKGGVKLSFADMRAQNKLLKHDSRAPGLEEGQERLVEVDIDRPPEMCMPWGMQYMMDRFRDLSLDDAGSRDALIL